MKACRTGLISAFLVLLLTGCVNTPDKPVTKTKTVRIKPPSSLAEPCPTPEPSRIEINADLQDWVVQLVEALRACDADKQGLRDWMAGEES